VLSAGWRFPFRLLLDTEFSATETFFSDCGPDPDRAMASSAYLIGPTGRSATGRRCDALQGPSVAQSAAWAWQRGDLESSEAVRRSAQQPLFLIRQDGARTGYGFLGWAIRGLVQVVAEYSICQTLKPPPTWLQRPLSPNSGDLTLQADALAPGRVVFQILGPHVFDAAGLYRLRCWRTSAELVMPAGPGGRSPKPPI